MNMRRATVIHTIEVPSDTGVGAYRVDVLADGAIHCTCKSFETNHHHSAPPPLCKHGRRLVLGLVELAKDAPDCAWCGADCTTQFPNRRGEVFCSKSHRSSSNRVLKRLIGLAQDGV